VYVEIAEQSQHDNHVTSQQILTPFWKFARIVNSVDGVRKRYNELYLFEQNDLFNNEIIKNDKENL